MISKVLIRRFFTYGVGLGCFSAIVFFSLIEPNLPLPVVADSDRPDFLFEGIRLSQLEEGKLVWEMTADVATVRKSDHVAHLSRVDGTFYTNGRPVFNVKGPSCVLDLKSSDLSLFRSNAVFFQTKKPVLLTATILRWISDEQRFFGTDGVTIKSPGFMIRGDYFYVDIPTEHLEISENSHAEIIPGRISL